MNSQLNNIPIRAGCTRLIVKYLEQIALDLKDSRDKYVALIWDEISLQPALYYNKKQDRIIGFEDWGMRRTRKIADHAIVFYLRCLKSGNKMPLGYGFCESTTKTHQLIRCVKQWLVNISASGLIPVAVVCDQGGTNMAAINSLISDSNKIRIMKNLPTSNSFMIKNHKVIPVYDYVHLIKGTRNNLLTKDLDTDTRISCALNKKYASWDDIQKAYDIDKNSLMRYRQMEKITEKHIIPKLIPKMRVKYATQVFSRTVSNFMDVILNVNGGVVPTQQGDMIMSKSASTTCEFVRFMNDLFDSFNGKHQQGLSSIITATSGHCAFWQEACKKIKNMRYVEKLTKKIPSKTAPNLKNWIWTMKGTQEIWKTLRAAKFESLNLKFLNQDPAENFFSQIRSNGFANRNPSCEQFEGGFKTLLICNLSSKHSIGANCKDTTEGSTLALTHLMNLSQTMKEMNDSENTQYEEVECNESAIPRSDINEKLLNEKKIIDIIRRKELVAQCEKCAKNHTNAQTLIEIEKAIEILEQQFPEICHKIKILEKTRKILENQCFLTCSVQCTHLKETLILITAEEFLKAWCKFMNNILCRKINVHSDNFMYKIAARMSNKYGKKMKPESRI